MNQRIIFTVNSTTISRDAARTELSLHDDTLTIYPEGTLPGWTLPYDSPEEARQAFNYINTVLASGEPKVIVPARGFLTERKMMDLPNYEGSKFLKEQGL